MGQGRADDDLVSEERQLALLISSAVDYAIFMLDLGGRIMTWNAGAERLQGWTREEVLGRSFELFSTDEDIARDHPAEELIQARHHGHYEEEGWRVRKDGTRFWASVVISLVRDEHGEPIGFGKVSRDLTARRLAEEQLRARAAELEAANQELDRFASVVAHDLVDPLSTIRGFAEVLARHDVPPDQATAFAEHIRSSSERLGRMLHGLLDFARAGGGTAAQEPVGLAGAVATVLADLGGTIARRDATVTVAVPADAVVLAGADDVRLMLQNLIANAVKFGAPDGPRVEVSAERQGRDWRVVVEDDGSGIAAGDQARIFQPFERAAGEGGQAGHGLGLAICQRLVERHGGALGVTGRPGEGSRFWMTLPAAD